MAASASSIVRLRESVAPRPTARMNRLKGCTLALGRTGGEVPLATPAIAAARSLNIVVSLMSSVAPAGVRVEYQPFGTEIALTAVKSPMTTTAVASAIRAHRRNRTSQ